MKINPNAFPNDAHQEFYRWQIEQQEEEWKRYSNCQMKILIEEGKLFLGRIWGTTVDGNVVLRFKSNIVPRIKQEYQLCFVGPDAPESASEWVFTYTTFRTSENPRLSSKNTPVKTIGFLNSDDEKWIYVLVSNFDNELLTEVKEKYLKQKIHPRIVLAVSDPPLDYLHNLLKFVSKFPENEILNLNIRKGEENWKPVNLDNSKDISSDIIELLRKNDQVIIQGPPGTGKSYLASLICSHFLKNKKSVCLTALTNNALKEIVQQPGLQDALENGTVYKTNLSSDEKRKIPSLKPISSITPIQGEQLLSTYYSLSKKIFELIQEGKRYDLLIIEEASQAFLATIAMFKELADKVLVIGDHKQLPPMVLGREIANEIHESVDKIIDGLKTYAFNYSELSYRLTKTRRLTPSSAKLTGIYYDNSLQSISDFDNNKNLTSKFKILFHEEGGVTLAKVPISVKIRNQIDLDMIVAKIGADLVNSNKKIEVAILTPYIDNEKRIYFHFNRLSNKFNRTTISTIHRVQGITVDYTILYLPLKNAGGFDLNDNIFNVATSRAKKGTLIISSEEIDLISSKSLETSLFLDRVENKTEEFKKLCLSNRPV
jgi:superfamily I DNA and/or RNA helicase